MDHFLQNTISPWTLPGGIQANDEDDQRRLSAFLKSHPLIEQAIASRIAAMPWTMPLAPVHVPAMTPQQVPAAVAPPHAYPAQLALTPIQISAPQWAAPTQPNHVAFQQHTGGAQVLPKHPRRFKAVCALYETHYLTDLEKQGGRTALDKQRLFLQLLEFLQLNHPALGLDPWFHEIDASHVSAFFTEQAKRPGKRVDEKGNPEGAAPTTMLKKLSDVTHLFSYARQILKSTVEDPASDLAESAEAWRQRAQVEDVHYAPFSDEHIKRIFEPAPFLAGTRDPDHFWCSLIGLHLGARLGEIVAAKVTDIGRIDEIDTWYIDIRDETAKNSNSIRRLPITEGLVRLGFIKYVEHVRRLGAEYIFPNRDWTCATAERDPSKSQSRRFGAYLDTLQIKQRCYVFHSFRHTVISAMQDAGVPLSHAMQIAGHEAMDHAVDTGRITEEQARSVHLSVYTRADLERMGQKYPIAALKEALESSLNPPIDYERLAVAAEIVIEHVKKVGGRFRTGWPAQRLKQTEALVARLTAKTPLRMAGPVPSPSHTTAPSAPTVGTVGLLSAPSA